ncbi:NAD+ synthetase [Xenococcus sp. PCC 7305]|uniref:NAD+ synthase n=1 Tax=Xenococcus sp. PCC 7305 TaxID=102125 RepID=UPI0002ABD4B4|nr:NAD+ synthetase [Xenococcus sp. PCC 7305]
MKIAIAQLNPTIGDINHNAHQIITAAEAAASQNTRLLLTPELSLCGYPPRDLLLYPRFIDGMTQKLDAIAQNIPTQIAILVGTVTANPQARAKGQKPLFNSMALLENGQVQQIFHKRLLPTYDVFDEDRYFQTGDEVNIFSLKLPSSSSAAKNSSLNIGVTICEDLWNDEDFWGQRNYEINPIADLVASGVDLIVNLSASPFTVGKNKLREEILHHAVTRHQIPIIYVNQVGANDDLIFDGNSIVLNKEAQILARGKSFESDLITVKLDDNKNLVDPETNSIAQEIEQQAEAEIFQALVLGVQDYARKCGFTKVLLGLSGGIDSALVAAIATAAMGQENVLGVLMPSPYSSEHSVTDAIALVKNLGIKSHKLAIQEGMTAYDQILKPLFADTEFGVAEENIQSRIRGNLLMAISNKFGYLLLSTGNKSEMAVGYCTLYGDMNGGLAVIADVPKTKVFDICRWLNQDSEIIPVNIINKPPSAELKPGQTDQDSLPPYEILDSILDLIIGQHKSEAEVIEVGYEPAIVRRIMKLLSRAEFKRRQAAPVLKITDRAFGTGWRMPIASKWLIEN